MMKDDRLSPTPVLVENLGSVLGFSVGHFDLLLLTIFSFQRRADTSQPHRNRLHFMHHASFQQLSSYPGPQTEADA
jgi:hypothetical protein